MNDNNKDNQAIKYSAVDKGKKWAVKDIILVVILSIAAMVVLMILNFATMFNDVLNLIFTMGLVFLFISPLYVYAAIKVNKPFVMSGFFAIFTVYQLFSYWQNMILIIGALVLIEVFMWKKDSYKTPWKMATSFGFMGIAATTTSYVSFANWDSFVETALKQGMTQEYVDTFRAWYTNPSIAIGVYAFTIAAAVLGCIASYLMFKKHFKKTGIL